MRTSISPGARLRPPRFPAPILTTCAKDNHAPKSGSPDRSTYTNAVLPRIFVIGN
jgi:hypothetical protein